jgi:hypothetical protein
MRNSTENQNRALVPLEKVESDDDYSSDGDTIVVEDTPPVSPTNEKYPDGYDSESRSEDRRTRGCRKDGSPKFCQDCVDVAHLEARYMDVRTRYKQARRREEEEERERVLQEWAVEKRKHDEGERLTKEAWEQEGKRIDTEHAMMKSKCSESIFCQPSRYINCD